MQFASPTSLLWLLLAIPIVIFYILKIRLRRVPVSTVMFWNQIFDEKKPRSIWQRLRHLVSLLIQLAFLGLLVFAVADPFFSWEKRNARRLVLVVDNSASMEARSGAVTRLTEAKQRGDKLIRGLRIRDQMAIVSAGTIPKVESGLTNHQRTLSNALNAIPATDGPTNVRDAIQMAQRLLVGHENAQVVVLSDGCFEGASEIITASNHAVKLDVIGEPIDNVAITQFQVRRSLIDVVGYQVLVEVTNFSASDIDCRLEVSLGEDLVDVVPLTLEPSGLHRQVLDHTSDSGGIMVAKIDVKDALSADNRAAAILPKRERQPVVLVTDGNLFLQSALAAIPLVQLQTTTEMPDAIPPNAIVIFDGKTPEQLPAGNVFVVQPSGPSNFWTLGEPIKDPIVTEQDTDSMLLTHVQLENVLMPNARSLQISSEHQVLAASIGGEPLYALIDHPQGKALVITVDLKKGDLPLRTAFPIMITNAVRWFRGERAELKQALSTGAIVEYQRSGTPSSNVTNAQPPATDEEADPDISARLALRNPDGAEKPLPLGVDRLTLGPLDHSGVWEIRRPQTLATDTSTPAKNPPAGSTERSTDTILAQYACNLTNAQESDLRTLAAIDIPETVNASWFGGRPVWFYLIVVALVLTTIEWFLYQRRWIS